MKPVMFKMWLMAVCALLLLFTGGPLGEVGSARAEAGVQLGVTAGIGGEYKDSGMVPVQVTMTNSGADVEGDLIVATGDMGNNTFSVAYYQPVSIAKGAAKQITITVPGSEVRSDSYVALMKADQIVAKAPVGGRRYSRDTLMVGVLAEDRDTANFLGVLPKGSFRNEVRVLPMKPEQVPTAGVQLRMIDLLVLNNFALDTLNAQQIQAIREWTVSGGMLILAGGAQYDKTAGELADLSPVEVGGVTTVKSLPSLILDKSKPVELTAPLTISSGTLKAGKALYTEGKQPLFASRTVEEGKVLYVAYDLAAEPLASWSGNGKLWADVLPRAFGSSLDDSREQFLDSVWALSDAAGRMPSLKIPNVGWFALFFGIYALIAGPVLFYILRHKRKQSYMWAIVPVLSVVTGIGIFSFGAMQRGSGVMVNQTGYLELTKEGGAKAKAVTAMFVPTGGDYQLTIFGEGLSQPIVDGSRWEEVPLIWASLQPYHTDVKFRDVEFWSMRKVATERPVPDAGKFVSDLSYADGALTGTVTNQTKYTLRDVKVVSDTQVQEVGEMAPGSTVQVKLGFQPSAQTQMKRGQIQRLTSQLVPQHLQGVRNEDAREQTMVETLRFRGSASYQMQQVMIAGWTNEPIVDATVKGESVHMDSLSLVTSELEVKPSKDGHVYYPAGTFDVTMSGSSVPVDDNGDGYFLAAGDITFDARIEREGKKLQISRLYLYTWSDDNTPFDKQVYNWKTKAFDPYDQVFVNNIMDGTKAAAYLSEDGVLRVKFSHAFPDERHIGIPSASVEGKVTHL